MDDKEDDDAAPVVAAPPRDGVAGRDAATRRCVGVAAREARRDAGALCARARFSSALVLEIDSVLSFRSAAERRNKEGDGVVERDDKTDDDEGNDDNDDDDANDGFTMPAAAASLFPALSPSTSFLPITSITLSSLPPSSSFESSPPFLTLFLRGDECGDVSLFTFPDLDRRPSKTTSCSWCCLG